MIIASTDADAPNAVELSKVVLNTGNRLNEIINMDSPDEYTKRIET